MQITIIKIWALWALWPIWAIQQNSAIRHWHDYRLYAFAATHCKRTRIVVAAALIAISFVMDDESIFYLLHGCDHRSVVHMVSNLKIKSDLYCVEIKKKCYDSDFKLVILPVDLYVCLTKICLACPHQQTEAKSFSHSLIFR